MQEPKKPNDRILGMREKKNTNTKTDTTGVFCRLNMSRAKRLQRLRAESRIEPRSRAAEPRAPLLADLRKGLQEALVVSQAYACILQDAPCRGTGTKPSWQIPRPHGTHQRNGPLSRHKENQGMLVEHRSLSVSSFA